MQDGVTNGKLVAVVQEEAHLAAHCPDAEFDLSRSCDGRVAARLPIQQGRSGPGNAAFKARLTIAADCKAVMVFTGSGAEDHPELVFASAQAELHGGFGVEISQRRLAAQAGNGNRSVPGYGQDQLVAVH